jgi:uncharacterized protein YjlB
MQADDSKADGREAEASTADGSEPEASKAEASKAEAGQTRPDVIRLAPSGGIPNNPRLPVILYRRALPPDADAIERRFAAHGWGSAWRNGIFDFDHYHCEGHEVLGVAAGRARVRLGGPGGPLVTFDAGDAVILPAGTGHRCEGASGDFLVVGAYPPGQRADIRRGPATPEEIAAIAALERPASDPVFGTAGGLCALWR